MCGFIVTNANKTNLSFANYFSQYRGPDLTTVCTVRNCQFVHNLLSITGDQTPQPFISFDEAVICLYNGEIYNYQEFVDVTTSSDGQCLIHAYLQFGVDFAQYLDGEFAIVLIDFNDNIILTATDTFATKPLWSAIYGTRFGFASYKSSLLRLGFDNSQISKAEPNQTTIYNLPTLEKKRVTTNVNFDIQNQDKMNFDDWCDAFENAVSKRANGVREKVFIGLSSGYDSGALSCAMTHLNIPYRAYSILARENEDVLRQRHTRLANGKFIKLSKENYELAKSYLRDHCEEFLYQIFRDGQLTPEEYMTEDQGAVGLSYICSLAKNDGYKIYISGQGADEVYSDYGYNGQRIYRHSCFGGRFPKNMSNIFPWRSFYYGTQMSYLAKEEYVSGSYGIEGRYPFLDKSVVQEFLWLSTELKNLYYKAPIHEYLTRHQYPFTLNEKIGFSSSHNLQ